MLWVCSLMSPPNASGSLWAAGRTPVRPELKYRLPTRMPPGALVRAPPCAAAAIAGNPPAAPRPTADFRNLRRFSIGFSLITYFFVGWLILAAVDGGTM